MPNQINAPQTPFNNPGQLFNGLNPAVPPVFNFVQRTPPDPYSVRQFGQSSPVPVVLTTLAATPADVAASPVTAAETTDTVPRQPITGSFAAVRALRILHQYRVAFWSDAGIIDQYVASNAADPTQAEIDTAYAQFLVFSYLPPALTPSAQEFGDLITPSKTAANVKNALPSMGINVTVVTNPVPTTADNPTTTATLPALTPFANNLSQFCALP